MHGHLLGADICTELSVHAQIEAVEPDGDMYDAKVKESSLDILDLGTRMAARKRVKRR